MNHLRNPLHWGIYVYLLWLLAFIFVPIILIMAVSFQEKDIWGGVTWRWTLTNYQRAFDPIYLSVLWSSVKLAGGTAISCLCLGFPMAWYMSKLSDRMKSLGLILILTPFISNFVVRAYALKFLIGVEGPLNQFLLILGLIRTPVFLDDVQFAVWFGMVTNYLPFMILPIYLALERFDLALVESAQDLGASSLRVFTLVVWPLVRPAVFTGVTLVFIPSMGELVVPDLLGGGKTMYVGGLLGEQFLKARDWPFGATLAVLMMVLVGCFSIIFKRGSRV
jgi:spermidine/putrescine transport system permease protein